jgi:hypothetical protein
MAGRFPGAQTISELWDVLQEGRETAFKPEELDSSILCVMTHYMLDSRYYTQCEYF